MVEVTEVVVLGGSVCCLRVVAVLLEVAGMTGVKPTAPTVLVSSLAIPLASAFLNALRKLLASSKVLKQQQKSSICTSSPAKACI